MKKINKLTIIISLIFFILSSTIIVFINIIVLESNKYDNEFASISFNEEITTKEYTFDEKPNWYFGTDPNNPDGTVIWESNDGHNKHGCYKTSNNERMH